MATCPSCQAQLDDNLAVCPKDGTPLTPAAPSLVGQVLGERYRIVRELGEGGMGQVYVGEHVILGKKLAVKVLRSEFSRHPDLVKRFQQEAVAASQIGQENIVDVADFGRTPDGSFYFVMEFVPGVSLANMIDNSGPIPVQRALPILLQVTRALGAAHQRGIVHRDVKADNVIVSRREDGSDLVKVLDFGISKVGEGPHGTRLTQVGMVVGTPQYMSPEQATGEAVDARADVYALGVLAYEVMTGTLPFQAENALGILLKHQNEKPQPPSERRPDLAIDSTVEALILKCMAKRADDRFQTMQEIGAEVVRIMGRLGVAAMFTPVPMPVDGAAPVPWTDPKLQALSAGEGQAPTLVSAPKSPAPARPPTELTEAELAKIKRGPGAYVAAGAALLLLLLGGGYLASRPSGAPERLDPVASPTPKPVELPAPALPGTGEPKPAVAEAPKPVEPPKPVEAPKPAPEKSRLHKVALRTVPEGASVWGKDGQLGTTPFDLELPEGQSSTVHFKAAGYRTADRLVSASDTTVEVTLAKASSKNKKGDKVAKGAGGKPGDSSTDDEPYGKVDDLKTPY